MEMPENMTSERRTPLYEAYHSNRFKREGSGVGVEVRRVDAGSGGPGPNRSVEGLDLGL
ncbi:hypothetical protein [Candidatus Palauibacter sp.]|uniref:hypothetical protein n=1 Tax=Candidatus Palauibacter sp. TaxID=3101350 RepID=UPI003B52B316